MGDGAKIKLYGQEFTREEFIGWVGDVSQVADIRLFEFTNGNERGVRAAEFYTGSGLSFTVLLDRGMDVDDAKYRGRPVSWQSQTGPVSPAFYESRDSESVRQFEGGLLFGCGPTYVGVPNEDQGAKLGLQGRLSNIPAKDVSITKRWDGNRYEMAVEGHMDEVGIWVDSLRVNRRIETALGESVIRVRDVIENVGFARSPFAIIYHCQLGWPVLSPGSRLYARQSKMEGWTGGPVDLDKWDTFQPPTPGYSEQVIYHTLTPDDQGMANVALINPDFDGGQGYGVYFRWNQDTLPYLLEWKMMGRKAYILGVEASNATSEGRSANRAQGILRFLEPDESATVELEIGLLTDRQAIAAWIERNAR